MTNTSCFDTTSFNLNIFDTPVRIENNANTSCFDTTSFNLNVFDTPVGNKY